MEMNDLYIIIPAYNEGSAIRRVISSLQPLSARLVVVDDGSSDDTAAEVSKTNAILIQHPFNLGQGAALQTGISFAVGEPGCRVIATFDADGQHRPEDVKAMYSVLKKEKLDVVLGSRFLDPQRSQEIPLSKRLLLRIATRLMNAVTGMRLTDTHNGLRVFASAAAPKLRMTMPDMSHASEILIRMAHGKLKYKEHPITVIYTDYSRSKGQPLMNSVNILFDLLMMRYLNKWR